MDETGPAALAALARIAPTLWFLAASLVLADLAGREGVFRYLGGRLARAGRGPRGRSPGRLWVATTGAAAATSAVLGLDAAAVLLTPVVLSAAARLGLRRRRFGYLTGHLANSGSLLMPVSNLTNLMVFAASGLSYAGFVELMALPWLVAVVVDAGLLALITRTGATGDGAVEVPAAPAAGTAPRVPAVALAVVGLVLAGFLTSHWTGVGPQWYATAGAAVLAARGLSHGWARTRDLVVAVNPAMLAVIAAAAALVGAVLAPGGEAARLVRGLFPAGPADGAPSLATLLWVTGVCMVLANVVNNLPATFLVLAAFPGPVHPAVLLAALVGLGPGANLGYLGSVATLLWRGVMIGHHVPPGARRFHLVGLVTAPVCCLAATVALWAVTR